MTMRRGSWTSFLLTASLGISTPFLVALSACAGHRPAAETPSGSARMKDSIPEKRAADRRATGLDLEKDDERWGFDAARERKRREKAPATTTTFPAPGTTPPPPPSTTLPPTSSP